MNYRPIMVMLFSSVIMFSCQDDVEDVVCYSFDLKSCRGDVWLQDSSPLTAENINDRTVSHLKSNGINVVDITIDMTFHDVVCLACDVCPSGQRVYVSIATSSEASLLDEDLLSLSKADCSSLNQ